MAKIDDLDDMMRQSMPKPIRPNMGTMEILQSANTGYDALRISQEIEEIEERDNRRDVAIQRTAQESIVHTRLLEKQLHEVQAQNEMLKAEAAANHAEIEANKKAAKKAQRLNIAAFVLSIVLSIISITASVLIAKYL